MGTEISRWAPNPAPVPDSRPRRTAASLSGPDGLRHVSCTASQTLLGGAPISPQDIEVDTSTDDRGEHPHEDVAGAEDPSRDKRDREPRDDERTEGYPDPASDLEHRSTLSACARASNSRSSSVGINFRGDGVEAASGQRFVH